MDTIANEILEKWSLENIAIAHRLGRVVVGESSIMIAASSSHRIEAFRACEEALDRVKASTEIWKKVNIYFKNASIILLLFV